MAGAAPPTDSASSSSTGATAATPPASSVDGTATSGVAVFSTGGAATTATAGAPTATAAAAAEPAPPEAPAPVPTSGCRSVMRLVPSADAGGLAGGADCTSCTLLAGARALRMAGASRATPVATTAPIATLATTLAVVPAAIEPAMPTAAAPPPAATSTPPATAKPGIDSPRRAAIASSGSMPCATAISSGAWRRRAAVRHERHVRRWARIRLLTLASARPCRTSAQVLSSSTSARPTSDLRAR